MTNSISALSSTNTSMPSVSGAGTKQISQAANDAATLATSATSSASLVTSSAQTDAQATADAVQKLLAQLDSQLNAARTQAPAASNGSSSTDSTDATSSSASASSTSTQTFDPADTNQDGTVSPQELAAFQATTAYLNSPAAAAKASLSEDPLAPPV